MDYKVQFLGLTSLSPLEDGGRLALLPDGRFPPPEIRPHLASISVKTDALGDLSSIEGWRDDEVTSDRFETEFFFPPSKIVFPSANKTEGVVSTNLDDRIHRLLDMDPRFQINRDANWIGCVYLRHGTIEAFRWPGYPDDGSGPVLAQWTVPHEGDDITITVTSRKGWPTRTIRLKAGSEIALINMSRGLPPKNQRGDHVEIYSELSGVPVTLKSPVRNLTPIPELPSPHPVFRTPRPADGIIGCSMLVGPLPKAGSFS